MKTFEKIVLIFIAVTWFFILVFIGVKVAAINEKVTYISSILGSDYDQIIIDNR